ncbi:serine hydrolase [Candidatus Leptofilum sp.]|uniref:serine hydrolase n=1 Tax=Candidatus Leptofilum sp. TaxID=3241576 RepID=UPI003B5A5C5B
MGLDEQIREICDGFDGRIGLAATNLQTEETIGYREDEMFPTASVIKLPVLLTLMQQVEDGLYSLSDPLMLRRADNVGGSGLLQHLSPGLTMPIRDWAFLMMSVSDNLATNVLIDHVGMAKVNAWLDDNGYPEVRLHRKINFDLLKTDQKLLGTATPTALTRMITAVFQQKHVSPAACTEMLRMMNKVGSDRVGRYLPFEHWDSDVPEAEKLHLAGKTGSLVGTRAQTAVIWRDKDGEQHGFTITVMSEGNPEPELWNPDAPGVLVIGRLARAIYDAWMGK